LQPKACGWKGCSILPQLARRRDMLSIPVCIDPSGTRPDPDGKPISRIGHEGATMMKVGGKYLHLGTAWSTDQGWQVVVYGVLQR